MSHFLTDAIIVLTGFKPALDAYRAGSGGDKMEHQFVSLLKEMTYCKGVEMVFEAVPASIVQIFAILLAEEKKVDALLSIVVSTATIGYTSSMISYDWDTSPTQKSMESSFYGYVPDAALSRAACFFSTMALSFAHVMLQTFSCAWLAVTNPWWLLYYFAADFGFFFLFKTARSDLLYFLNLNDLVRFVTTILTRIGAKIMINFTLLFQMRHPQEAGGLLCLSSLLFSVAGNFVSAYL